MPSTIKLVWAPSTNPTSHLLPPKLLTPSESSSALFPRASPPSPPHRPLIAKCTTGGTAGEGGGLKKALSGIVGEQVEELLKREENRELLDGLEKASQRVENAKRELAEIERQELEAKLVSDYITQLESRASEIAECQKEISEAKSMVEEAERTLSQDGDQLGDGYASAETENKEIDKDKERWQSIKAASVSALVGTVAGLPFSFTQVASISELILPLGVTFASCALFGVTFRYTMRRDLDNVQLKTGAPAAFGVVKGLATLDGGKPLELNAGSFVSHAFDGAIYVSQSLFVFLSAAVALDYCFKTGLLSPFPIKKSVSGSN
ncbi:hypothetical protein D8674_041526 [Pyrus ussuriensis x Pyrus communis]|uniref:Homer protein n=1 Tax=Pyrus ussuriensis x Pyrus communis TaxID=2448454 RepID=A0A5N5FU89_9ROSA|nr:uncharacterized protein LOC103949304 [Pyrus x bretschneideri]KAB2604752.1 hypothetical protein D8674_041526 [Pyrus ussuriensis x Pyrus communis]